MERAESTVQGLVLEHQGVLSGGVTCGGRRSGVAVAECRERRVTRTAMLVGDEVKDCWRVRTQEIDVPLKCAGRCQRRKGGRGVTPSCAASRLTGLH